MLYCAQKVEVKPPVVVKPIQAPLERPPADEPLTRLKMSVSDSLKQALANKLQQMNVSDDKPDGTVEYIVSFSLKYLYEKVFSFNSERKHIFIQLWIIFTVEY